MSSTVAPSRKACFTFEFMNTVHRVPKSQGALARQASWANCSAVYPNERAKVSRNAPHPDEQASLSSIRYKAPPLTNIAFMSCPPMSRMNDTSGVILRAEA